MPPDTLLSDTPREANSKKLSTLPNEIWFEIFDTLSAADLMTLASTSNRWLQLVAGYQKHKAYKAVVKAAADQKKCNADALLMRVDKKDCRLTDLARQLPEIKRQALTGKETITVSDGGDFSLILVTHPDGSTDVYSRGSNRAGQLGHGDTVFQNDAIQIMALAGKKVLAVAASCYCSLFLIENLDGSTAVYSCGLGRDGRLGHGDTATQLIPIAIRALAGKRVRAISVSGSYSSFLVENPNGTTEVHSSGAGFLGPSGDPDELIPTQIMALAGKEVVSISETYSHSLFLVRNPDGTIEVYSRGLSEGGQFQLGHGNIALQDIPIQLMALAGKNVVAVSARNNLPLLVVKNEDGTLENYVWKTGEITPTLLSDPATAAQRRALIVKQYGSATAGILQGLILKLPDPVAAEQLTYFISNAFPSNESWINLAEGFVRALLEVDTKDIDRFFQNLDAYLQTNIKPKLVRALVLFQHRLPTVKRYCGERHLQELVPLMQRVFKQVPTQEEIGKLVELFSLPHLARFFQPTASLAETPEQQQLKTTLINSLNSSQLLSMLKSMPIEANGLTFPALKQLVVIGKAVIAKQATPNLFKVTRQDRLIQSIEAVINTTNKGKPGYLVTKIKRLIDDFNNQTASGVNPLEKLIVERLSKLILSMPITSSNNKLFRQAQAQVQAQVTVENMRDIRDSSNNYARDFRIS